MKGNVWKTAFIILLVFFLFFFLVKYYFDGQDESLEYKYYLQSKNQQESLEHEYDLKKTMEQENIDDYESCVMIVEAENKDIVRKFQEDVPPDKYCKCDIVSTEECNDCKLDYASDLMDWLSEANENEITECKALYNID